jgi:hypothetical protein
VLGIKVFPDDIVSFGNTPAAIGFAITNRAARDRIDALRLDGFEWREVEVAIGKRITTWSLLRVSRMLEVIDPPASELRRFESGRKELGLAWGGEVAFKPDTPRTGLFTQAGEPFLGAMVGPDSAAALVEAGVRGLVLEEVGRIVAG